MPQFPRNCAVFISALVVIGSLNCKAVEPVRVWKGGDGKTIAGQLLWAQDGDVYIKAKKTGRKTKIALSNFSLGDQAYIKRFLQVASEKNIAYQFQLCGELYRKKELGTIREQEKGQFFIDGNQKKGVLVWAFKLTAPIPDEVSSGHASLLLTLGKGKNDGTKKRVLIYKNSRLVASRNSLAKGKRHRFDIPLSSLLDLTSNLKKTNDSVIELKIVVPHTDGINVWGRNSSAPPELKIFFPKGSQ